MGGAEFYYRTKRSLRDVNFGEKNSLLPTFQPVHRAFGDLHSDPINLENSLTSYFTITIPRNHLLLLQEGFVLLRTPTVNVLSAVGLSVMRTCYITRCPQ
jgi:hypothetical protein